MTGRRFCSDAEAFERGFYDQESAQRRRVLRETVAAFEQSAPPDHYQRLAAANLGRWRAECAATLPRLLVDVLPGDWGEVTLSLTKTYGACFAVLNMANAYVPGGAYVEGAIAQEENMFRRTDCHFHIGPDEFDAAQDRYLPKLTRLLSANDGLVYLDTREARVCIRGPEDRSLPDLGYAWLPDDEVFPFFELRASAQDLRDGSDFDDNDARRRIAAQFDTLRAHGLRYVVLSAFGCGAFCNPARRVAQLYQQELTKRKSDFNVVAFAIFAAGYGPDNYTPFANVFELS
jgi:poly (ADP-ribose) glycohydrolase (PARG)-like protein